MSFLLTSLGFSWPNNLILILGVHGLAINPLLSQFELPWACGGPFSLFYLIHYPWDTISFFLGFFESTCFFKTHLFTSWTCDPLFLLLGPNDFFAIYFVNFLLPLLLGFFSFCLGSHKWPSTSVSRPSSFEILTPSLIKTIEYKIKVYTLNT